MKATERDREAVTAAVQALIDGSSLRPDLQTAVAELLADERERAESAAYDEGAADALWGVTAERLPDETLTVAYLRAESDRIRRAAQDRP